MYLRNIQKNFFDQLLPLYSKEELHSFFYIVAAHYLGYSRADIVLKSNEVISGANQLLFQKAIHRLLKQEPIQYIIGQTEFYGLPINVNPNTLIPRPETEELVEWILSEFKNKSSKLRILDIGTGSGCIAIALAKNFKEAIVSALDLSKKALQIAGQNAVLNDVGIHFFQQDILKCDILPQKYNIMVSNPPYVRESEKGMMNANVLQYEPETALYVTDKNPLIFYKKIGLLAKGHLAINGKLYFEINEYLGEDMMRMLEKIGFSKIELKKDFRGALRMICCQLPISNT